MTHSPHIANLLAFLDADGKRTQGDWERITGFYRVQVNNGGTIDDVASCLEATNAKFIAASTRIDLPALSAVMKGARDALAYVQNNESLDIKSGIRVAATLESLSAYAPLWERV